jgi:hypothetical protein
MLSTILLRLIKEALLPAVFIIGSKVVSVIVLAQAFSVAWDVELSSFLPNFVFEDQVTSVFINSYSNLFMYIVVIIGFAWVLTRAYHFHDTHIKPARILQLLAWNLTGLLTNSEDIYHKGIVWISYIWLVTLLIGIHALMGLNYVWMSVFALGSSVIATWYFIADVEREVVRHENTL